MSDSDSPVTKHPHGKELLTMSRLMQDAMAIMDIKTPDPNPNPDPFGERFLALPRMAWNAKDFNTLELEFKFLRTFLKYTVHRCFDCQDLRISAEAVDPMESNLDHDFYWRTNMAATLLSDVQCLRSPIRLVHRIALRSSHYHSRMRNEFVIEFIPAILENLKDLVVMKVDLAAPLKIELKSLEGRLRFLRTFLMFTGKSCTDHELVNDLFTYAKVAADTAAYLSYSCLVKEMDEGMLYQLVFDLSDLVLNIDPVNPEVRHIYIGVLKASSSESSGLDLCTSEWIEITVDFVESLLKMLMELLCIGLVVPTKDQILILQEELAFLRVFLMDPPNKYTDTVTLSDLLTQSIIISKKAGLVVYSLYDEKMNDEIMEEVNSSLVDVLNKTKLIKAEITEIYHKVPKSPCPKFSCPDDLGFFDGLLGNLRELINNMTDSVTCLNLPVEPLVEELQFLRSFLSKIGKQLTEQEKLKILWTQIIDVAHKAEYIIDSLMVANGPIWHGMLWLDEVRKEIEVLKEEVNKIGEKKMQDSEVHHAHGAEISDHASTRATSLEMDGVVVGREDEEEIIVNYLTRGSAELQMVSIVGMPGLGKTQFAKKIYNHPTVKDYFHVHAWCYVSQQYNRKYLLSQILGQDARSTEKLNMSEKTDEELGAQLCKSLKGNRYLILMDDLWDVEAWDALRRSFPDDNKGSRIMITSRFHNLKLKASGSKIHHLRPLIYDESWQLLLEKLFQRKSCPPELREVGQQIARNCNGLPLTVVVVAGILARIGKEEQLWRKVMESQSSYIVGDPNKQSIKVIELSYNQLPDYLKPCFLYIGASFKNKYIPIGKIICLWIAEGFVQKVEHKSLENIAEDYLKDLVGRSLLIIGGRGSIGDIEFFRIHDLIHDFCRAKAEEDNFFHRIEQLPTSDSSRYIICDQRRISCDHRRVFVEAVVYSPHVRSLLFTGRLFRCFARGHEVESICDKYKLLRVLDLACITIQGTFPDGIYSLSHLRYLAMRGDFRFIPSSIVKLRNLKTFIVKGAKYLVYLPITIWNMVNLRYLHIEKYAYLSQPSCGLLSRLDNLQTISTIYLFYGDDSVKLMEGFANVKSLSCVIVGSWDPSENCNRLPVLATLGHLESLNLSQNGGGLQPYKFSFPSSIKKLIMEKFYMPWNQLSIIGKLPNLEVLELLTEAVQGEEWDMRDGEFPKLKALKLKHLDIRKWSFPSTDFPPLECLVLQSIRQLEEIPLCLGEVPTLKMIMLDGRSAQLQESAKKIQEEQLDMGNEEFKVAYI